ncbi:MAG: hypothetical protein K8R58_02695 [Bacteroidales bacterium]|nr:hypothetical protein [Bacteroidales bacterium]
MDWDIIVLIILYLFFIAYLTIKGRIKKIGSLKIFIISILFTPFIGLICLLTSPEKITYDVTQYKCEKCGYFFTEKHIYCPNCEKEGVKVLLTESINVMTG